MEQAKAGLVHAYAPYSKVRVAAALLAKSGKVYVGCNVENASFSATVCAERTALCKAVSEGERAFLAIALTATISSVTPCGICRQCLAEFSPEMRVITQEGGQLISRPLRDYLPYAFSLPEPENDVWDS
jgi:cytidine deaminase